MSIINCTKCNQNIDSDFIYTINFEDKDYCNDCFEDKFMHEDCGGFKNKQAMAAYDGNYCDCD